jgi:hypothetical protein
MTWLDLKHGSAVRLLWGNTLILRVFYEGYQESKDASSVGR